MLLGCSRCHCPVFRRRSFLRPFISSYPASKATCNWAYSVPDPTISMSALGQKQTSAHVPVMSALPPKADIGCVVEYLLSANFANALTRAWASTCERKCRLRRCRRGHQHTVMASAWAACQDLHDPSGKPDDRTNLPSRIIRTRNVKDQPAAPGTKRRA